MENLERVIEAAKEVSEILKSRGIKVTTESLFEFVSRGLFVPVESLSPMNPGDGPAFPTAQFPRRASFRIRKSLRQNATGMSDATGEC